MTTVYPDYYKEFKCISKECKHNCCIGWEIDIDNTSYSIYSKMDNAFGKRLINGINHESNPCFKQDENGRCVFLNKEGLCEIIINLGEDFIPDICYDHPRFRNFYSSFTELGLGLCCEEAARIILNNKETVKLISDNDDCKNYLTNEEKEFLIKRNEIFKILQNRSISFKKRLEIIENNYKLKQTTISPCDYAEIYLSLERLDEKWDKYIHNIKNAYKFNLPTNMDIVLEQLTVYFIYRHLSDSLYENNFCKRLSFCIHAVRFICEIFLSLEKESISFNEICRMYSCEIEYSDENVNKLLNLM